MNEKVNRSEAEMILKEHWREVLKKIDQAFLTAEKIVNESPKALPNEGEG